MIIYILLSLSILLYKSLFNSLGFIRNWARVCSPCMCKWKWFSFHLVFNEFGEILDLVGQSSGRRSKRPNHYKLSVFYLSFTKILTWCSYQFLSSNKKYSSFIFNLLNLKKFYSPLLAYSMGPNRPDGLHVANVVCLWVGLNFLETSQERVRYPDIKARLKNGNLT